jgi:ABC-type phosphate transport system substrate-binding protein
VIGRDNAQIKAIWSKILFTGRGLPPKQLPDSEAIKKAVAANPNAVGYIEKSLVDASVKVVLTVN